MDALIYQEMGLLSRLELLDSKTGSSYVKCGRVCQMQPCGRRRILGGEHGSHCYHVMSRTAGGDYLMKPEEKEAFRIIMRRMANFSGVQVLTWTAMDNHFHVLARVPEKKTYLKRFEDKEDEAEGAGEERLMKHLSSLYSDAYIKLLRKELVDFRTRGMSDQAEQVLERYKRRFCDISLYIKEVKDLQTMSTYIDLNAVRAEIVDDPKDYRWCGYAEAVAGVREAKRGLCRVMGKPVDSWVKCGSWYRCWLMIDGEEVLVDKVHHVKSSPGITKEKAKAELEKGGSLSLGQHLRSRVAYFTEGVAIGCQAFVEAVFEKNRDSFGASRTRAAKPMCRKANNKIQNKTSKKAQDSDHAPTQNQKSISAHDGGTVPEGEFVSSSPQNMYALQGAMKRL